jgi:hypothetical protein
LALQGHGFGVAWQAIEIRAVETGEGFQLIQRASRFKRFRIQFQRSVGGIAAGATTGGFLARARMRCAVGAEEEFGVAADRRLNQRLPMLFTFKNRQAVVVWTDTALENRIADYTAGDGR